MSWSKQGTGRPGDTRPLAGECLSDREWPSIRGAIAEDRVFGSLLARHASGCRTVMAVTLPIVRRPLGVERLLGVVMP